MTDKVVPNIPPTDFFDLLTILEDVLAVTPDIEGRKFNRTVAQYLPSTISEMYTSVLDRKKAELEHLEITQIYLDTASKLVQRIRRDYADVLEDLHLLEILVPTEEGELD